MEQGAKHTPGPWKVSRFREKENGLGRYDVSDGGAYYVASTSLAAGPGGEELANAHLIAAAPELLEEAANVLREYGHMMEAHDAEYLEDAIAKATGQE